MKSAHCFLVLFLLFSCRGQENKLKDIKTSKLTSNKNVKDTLIPDDKDTVIIDKDDSYKITRGELRRILKENPELNEEVIEQPDIAYAKRERRNDSYNSEVGQDTYYMLYGYFLKKKNGEKKYREQRKTLINIYRDINSIFQKMAHGGTYFGHQYSRISGYVEYSVYLNRDDSSYFRIEYNISKQKKLYLKSLEQLITDENSFDFDVPPKEKQQFEKELFEKTKDINHLITNNFYLKRAQEFQYSNY